MPKETVYLGDRTVTVSAPTMEEFKEKSKNLWNDELRKVINIKKVKTKTKKSKIATATKVKTNKKGKGLLTRKKNQKKRRSSIMTDEIENILFGKIKDTITPKRKIIYGHTSGDAAKIKFKRLGTS